ncbi:hypothetical protein [Nocardia lijiangensis]|uniref:hypothetical protein n=1 Tax=Nocardia lijiangensis TaxID=299618 RepID=UPI000A634696|nr:hypothetical protein [Nocardia lijiangensis]
MSTVTVAVLLGFVCCALVIRAFAPRGEVASPRRVTVDARRARSGNAVAGIDA